MSEVSICLENVSMMFNLSRDKVLGLKEYLVKAVKGQLFYDEFWALKNVSITINRGEVVGVLGLNGSGKSTLLKLIAGVFKPTKGMVATSGLVAPLLELGAGFDYEFSAKENVYMHGAMLGVPPSEMKKRYKDIMDFAELWEFENVPLKNLSSGMCARLGFAVATQVTADILIIDEILGVGDYHFARKCEQRVQELLAQSVTVIVVSHSIETIMSLCNRAVLLRKGELVADGNVKDVVDVYHLN